MPARRGRAVARFSVIHQPWLREAIKRWSRFRLASGYTFTTIDSGTQSLARFSLFLDEHPDITGFAGITREALEDAKDEVARLRAENAALRDQLARRLGEQRVRR